MTPSPSPTAPNTTSKSPDGDWVSTTASDASAAVSVTAMPPSSTAKLPLTTNQSGPMRGEASVSPTSSKTSTTDNVAGSASDAVAGASSSEPDPSSRPTTRPTTSAATMPAATTYGTKARRGAAALPLYPLPSWPL